MVVVGQLVVFSACKEEKAAGKTRLFALIIKNIKKKEIIKH